VVVREHLDSILYLLTLREQMRKQMEDQARANPHTIPNQMWKFGGQVAPSSTATKRDCYRRGVENSQAHLGQGTVLGVVIGGFGEAS